MTLRRTLFLMALAPCGTAWAAPGEYQCLIEPYQKIEIRSSVEALIETVHVQRGSTVRKGQALVQLNAGVEQAALESARYRAVMEGQVRSSQARVDYARDKLKRREELSRQNFVSSQDRDDAAAELRVAEAELLRQRTLYSPFNGVVTEVEQHPGELAQTGEGARPILKMAQIHPLRVEAVLPASLYASIRQGASAEVEAEAPSKGSYTARVQIVDKVVDSASGTFGVRLELPNPAGNILAGVKCKVRFR